MIEDAYGKIEDSSKRYFKSPKGREAVQKYLNSEKGKEARRRYLESNKGKIATLRYYNSPKGKDTRERRKEQKKVLTECSRWLQDNPGKTPSDFFAQLENSNE